MDAVELFAGAGGLGMGLSRAGFKPTRVVEWDRWCCNTLRANRHRAVAALQHWPETFPTDVRDVDFSDLEGKVTLVSGGPPCQPFSLGGRHRANADVRDMWSEAVRAVREMRPAAFIFENVKGLTRATFATYLQYIERQLSAPQVARYSQESWLDHLGRLEREFTGGRSDTADCYKVVYQVLNAADYGVPQRRERIVFVGFRGDLGVRWKFPEATHSQDALLWDQARVPTYWERHRVPRIERSLGIRPHSRAMLLSARPVADAWRTVRDALQDLPDPERQGFNPVGITDHHFQAGARSYVGHTGSPLDEPAKTLKAGVHGVPGGENMLVRADGTVRYFTVREAARLQTFPDDFRLNGAWSEAMRQLGNAVPVDLAMVIGKDVHATLNDGINAPNIAPNGSLSTSKSISMG